MDKPQHMDAQEKEIQKLAEDIHPSENNAPDSLAEATTAPLPEDALGGNANQDNATQNDIPNK